jgi:long-chain acyl-CoA synthetase
MSSSATAARPDTTLAQLLRSGASTRGDRVWMRKKKSGLWQEHSWRSGYERVRHFSLGLTAMGFEPGQALAIIGDNDPEWFWSELAAQAAGGFVAAMERSRPPEEIQAALRQFSVKLAAVQDRETVDKLLRMKGEVPSLSRIIYWNPKGIESDLDPMLASFESVAETGRGLDGARSGLFEDGLTRFRGSDPALVRCGPIGGPAVQSVKFTHDTILAAVEPFTAGGHFTAKDSWLSFVPPSSLVEQVMGLAGSLASGMCLDIAESRDTAQADLREVGSTLVCYPAALWETLAATVKERIEKTTFMKRVASKMAAPAGSRMAQGRLGGHKPGPLWRTAGAVAEFGFYHPLKARIGLANARHVYSFGAELTRATLDLWHGMGLDLTQLEVTDSGVTMRKTPEGGTAGP